MDEIIEVYGSIPCWNLKIQRAHIVARCISGIWLDRGYNTCKVYAENTTLRNGAWDYALDIKVNSLSDEI